MTVHICKNQSKNETIFGKGRININCECKIKSEIIEIAQEKVIAIQCGCILYIML